MKNLYCPKCLLDVPFSEKKGGFLKCEKCNEEVLRISFLQLREQKSSLFLQRRFNNLANDLINNINQYIDANSNKLFILKKSDSYIIKLENTKINLKTCSRIDDEGKYNKAFDFYANFSLDKYNDPTIDLLRSMDFVHLKLGTNTWRHTDSIIKPFYYPSSTEITGFENEYMEATYPRSLLPKKVIRGLDN
jgi:hypothetical protein